MGNFNILLEYIGNMCNKREHDENCDNGQDEETIEPVPKRNRKIVLEPMTLLFICDKCGPLMNKKPEEIHGGLWCPNCPIGENIPRQQGGFIIPPVERTIASFDPVKMSRWLTGRNECSPFVVCLGSNKRAWFNCAKCRHDFYLHIRSMTKVGRWCPYCIGYAICDDEECTSCYMKSFASVKLPDDIIWMAEMNIGITRRQIARSSGKNYYFKCIKCQHILHKQPNKFASGYGCGYCLGKKSCEDVKSCTFCTSMTAAGLDPEKLKYLVKTPGDPELHTVPRSSRYKFTFICAQGHEFKLNPFGIFASRNWCARCARTNKNMTAIEKKVKSYEDLTFIPELPVKINGRTLFWDMVVKHGGKTFHIESDGPQHFSVKDMTRIRRIYDQNKGLVYLKDQRIRDLSKENYIRDNDGLLFRVSYRQLKQIPELVEEMIRQSSLGTKGVIYMDTIYTNWVEL